MPTRRVWNMLAGALAVVVLLSSCAPAATPTPQVIVKRETQVVKETVVQQVTAAPVKVTLPSSIVIGSLEPLTGGLATFGTEARNAQIMAIEHINAAGGIKSLGGLKLEVVGEDTTGEVDAARLAAESLISKYRPVAALGFYMSRLSLAGSEVTEREKVILILDALVESLMRRGYKYLLRAAPSCSQHGRTGIEFAMGISERAGMPLKSIAILNEDSAFGRATALGAAEAALEKQIPIVYQREYPYDLTDVSSIVAGIQSANPDVVLHACYFNDGVLFAKTFKETGYIPKFIIGMGGSGYTDGDSIKALGDVANYYVNTVSYNPAKNTPQNRKFVDEFKAKYGKIPTEAGGIAYYSMWVYAEMFELSGKLFPNDPLNPDNLMAAAHQLDLKSGPAVETIATNQIQFDGTGQNIFSRATVLQVLNGEPKVIWPLDESEATVVYPRPDSTVK